MALPSEYKKFIGRFNECQSPHGKRMLIKYGFGPETENVVEETKPKKTKKKPPKTKKNTTK